MVTATPDFEKLDSDRHYTIFHSPSGGATLGVTNVHEPLAAEINNTGGTSGMINVSPSISWNDWDFGTQASETTNQPSFADAASYSDFGQENYGGNISYWMPAAYDDDSNTHSLVYDLTDAIDAQIDVVTRLDGEILTSAAAADGDFVSVYRVEGGADQNPFTPGEDKRRTRNWFQKSDFDHFTVVGDHAITAIEPASFPAGESGRIRASQQGRDVTNRLEFTSDDADVIDIDLKGGFYTVTGSATDTATVTITDPWTGDTDTVAVTVS